MCIRGRGRKADAKNSRAKISIKYGKSESRTQERKLVTALLDLKKRQRYKLNKSLSWNLPGLQHDHRGGLRSEVRIARMHVPMTAVLIKEVALMALVACICTELSRCHRRSDRSKTIC